ncbi:disulfide bond formation protein B [Phycisphaerales bacterium]|nr:disulfide bond formation protein B [bacterium]MDC0429544.1 disulfide bond formation protein B [Phycisphaerales bacterium]RPG14720.1 MAG: disulfide bond formation protein B [Phycisphaera sp. TMED9]
MNTLHGWPRISFVLLHVYVLGVCGVVIGAFAVQFLGKELPCPLCVLQRMAMLLAAMGPMFIIKQTSVRESDSKIDGAIGFGMSIVASILGLYMSGRQVLLHILPGDPGYGDAVFGLHLYTWAFIVFSTIILVSGLNLMFSRFMTVGKLIDQPKMASRVTAWVLGIVVTANVASSFAEGGTDWFLPDNPTEYKLIEEFKEFLDSRSSAGDAQKAN